MKSLTTGVPNRVADDFKEICQHHGYSVNKVLMMLVDRVISHSERLPAAMKEFEGASDEVDGPVEQEEAEEGAPV